MVVRPRSIPLDAEALSQFARNDRRMQACATVARRTDSALYASAVSPAETTDGADSDAAVRRVARAVRVQPVTDQIGYAAGQLRARAAASRRNSRDLTVDAAVAATALALPRSVVVLTGDPDDLTLLLADTAVVVEKIG